VHAGLPFRGNGTCTCGYPFYGTNCELGVCPAGMFYIEDLNGTRCELCKGLSYKNSTGNHPCTECPVSAVAGSSDGTRCECAPGTKFRIESGEATCFDCEYAMFRPRLLQCLTQHTPFVQVPSGKNMSIQIGADLVSADQACWQVYRDETVEDCDGNISDYGLRIRPIQSDETLGACVGEIKAYEKAAFSSDGRTFDFGTLRSQGGRYELCWCLGIEPYAACTLEKHFRTKAGDIVLYGPIGGASYVCVKNFECKLARVEGEGLAEGDTVMVMRSCASTAQIRGHGERSRYSYYS